MSKKLYSNAEWYKFAENIKRRDGFKCQQCLRSSDLQVHHIHYVTDKKPWEYPSASCITLCKGCHPRKEGHGASGVAGVGKYVTHGEQYGWVAYVSVGPVGDRYQVSQCFGFVKYGNRAFDMAVRWRQLMVDKTLPTGGVIQFRYVLCPEKQTASIN